MWVKSLLAHFSRREGMRKYLTGGGTHTLSFPSRENPGKFPGNNLRTDRKESK